MVLSCTDTVEVILSAWPDAGAGLMWVKIEKIAAAPGM